MTRHRAGKALGLLALTAVACLATSLPAHAIAGGSAAADGAYPYVAKIDIGGGLRSCSGVLIDPNWVLSAKSCFPENSTGGKPAKATKVTVGRTALSGTAGQVLNATDLIVHGERNLALVRLSAAAEGIAPASLAATAPAVGDLVRVAGYGRTATEWTPDRLQTGLAKVTATAANTLTVLGEGSVSVCRGDSGGPAFREVNGRAEVIGVHAASWQGGCMGESETRREVTETRLDDLRGWVQGQLIGLTATPLPQHGNQLTWLNPASAQATAYRVYGARTADVPLTQANLLGTVNGVSFRHTALGAKQQWHYRVVPVTAAGDGPASTIATATTKVHTVSDFNGDGRDDIAAVYDYSNADTGTFTFDGTADGVAAPVSKHRTGPGNWFAGSGKYFNGDVNGDGYADFGAFYNYGNAHIKLWVRYGSAEGLKDAKVDWDSGPGQWEWDRAQFVAGDFNGDGRTDVTGVYGYDGGRTAFFLFAGKADGVAAPVLTWDSGNGNWERTSSQFVAGDFNGDGRDDLAGIYNYGNFNISLFTFDGTPEGHARPKQQWNSGPGQWDVGRSRFLPGDFDGDGRTDIGGLYGYDNGRTALFIMKASASGVASPAKSWDTGEGNWNLWSSSWVAGDFNGDGRTDLAGFYDYGNAHLKLWHFRAKPDGNTSHGDVTWDSGPGQWEMGRARFIP